MAVDHPFRARIKPIPGETPKRILRKAFYLPAILRGFAWQQDFAHGEYDTIREGQFSVPAMGGRSSRQLLSLDDVESLTVVWNPSWLADRERVWGSVRERLLRLGQGKAPFELMVKPKGLRNNVAGRDTLILHLTVTLRGLRIEEREGEPDTEYFTLSLKEWRHAGLGRRGAGKAQDGGGHRLDANDTLNSLAMEYFHSYGSADAIAKANGIRNWGKTTPLKRHPRFKRRGAKVKIPSIPRTSPVGFPRPPRGAKAKAR